MIESEVLDVAVPIARAAGSLLLERATEPARGVGTKSSPTDLVSDADRDSESLIISMIEKARPGDGVLSEEGGGGESQTGYRWVVDPLDGTINYLYKIPAWAVSIAVEDSGGLLAGVVFHPSLDEMFTATRDRGARLNGAPIRVSGQDDLSQALIATGFSYELTTRGTQADLVPTVLRVARDIRRGGSAALDLVSTACGRLDGYYESAMNPWDRAAGELIVREAGGIVTDLPAPGGDSVGVIAAGPNLHAKLSAVVNP